MNPIQLRKALSDLGMGTAEFADYNGGMRA